MNFCLIKKKILLEGLVRAQIRIRSAISRLYFDVNGKPAFYRRQSKTTKLILLDSLLQEISYKNGKWPAPVWAWGSESSNCEDELAYGAEHKKGLLLLRTF
jgi:hypothetical protein